MARMQYNPIIVRTRTNTARFICVSVHIRATLGISRNYFVQRLQAELSLDEVEGNPDQGMP